MNRNDIVETDPAPGRDRTESPPADVSDIADAAAAVDEIPPPDDRHEATHGGFFTSDKPLGFLADRWRVVAVAAATGALIALIGSLLGPEVYVAAADYTVSPAAAVSDPNDVLNAINTLDSRNRAFLETAADVFQSQPVVEAGLGELGLDSDFADEIEVEAGVLPSAIIVRLSVAGPDAEAVTNLAVKVGNAATEKVEALYPLYAFELLEPPPLPVRPSSPVPVRDAFLGLVVGLAAGVGLAYLIDRRL